MMTTTSYQKNAKENPKVKKSDLKELVAANKLLSVFFTAIDSDERIGCTHISLYLALFRVWQINLCDNPFRIDRDIIMKKTKISGRGTFNKRMRELREWGYIQYETSYDYRKGNWVWMGVAT
jgi:hypothetical protein